MADQQGVFRQSRELQGVFRQFFDSQSRFEGGAIRMPLENAVKSVVFLMSGRSAAW